MVDDEFESSEAWESVLSEVPQAPIETTIAALNGIRSPYVIHPGQKLSLGGANGNSAANTGRRSVVITAGDCLWNHFGADSARVAAANGISNPNLVRAGTVIHY